MRHSIDRRTALKLSLAGVGATVLHPGTALADDDDGFPPVPGMLGDRRANEMWYQFDEVVFIHPAKEVLDTYASIHAYVGGEHFVSRLTEVWLDMSASPEYPRNYTAYVTPIKQELTFLSRLQLAQFDKFYLPNSSQFVEAFAYFGQGVLFDPRRADIESEVHTMDYVNGGPPPGYHGWHAYLRAMMFLNLSRDRWARINPAIAFAWALQSIAKPSAHLPNQPLPQATVARQAAFWLPRSSERLDQDFRSSPYPEGIS